MYAGTVFETTIVPVYDATSRGHLAAAFDTRVHASALLTGQASKGITKRLRTHGFDLVVDGESFFVDKSNHLEAGRRAIQLWDTPCLWLSVWRSQRSSSGWSDSRRSTLMRQPAQRSWNQRW